MKNIILLFIILFKSFLVLGQFNDYSHEGRYNVYYKYDLLKYAKFDWVNGTRALKDAKWGIINDKTGELIVPVEYDQILQGDLRGNYVVRKNGKYGIIKEGKLVCPLNYDYITPYYTEEQYRFAVSRGLWGVINNQGDVIIPFRYTLIYGDGYGGIACLDGNKWKLYLANGEELKIPDVKSIRLLNKHYYGITYTDDENAVMDHQQNIIIPKSKKKYFNFSGFEDKQWLSVTDEKRKRSVWDVRKGTWILEPKYDMIGSRFNNQAFFTRSIITTTENGETTRKAVDQLLDLSKKPIINGMVEEYGKNTLPANLIMAKQDGVWWLYDHKGAKFLPSSFKSQEEVVLKHKEEASGAQYLSVKTENGWGIMDLNKKEIIPFKYYSFGGGDPFSFYAGPKDKRLFDAYEVINQKHKYGVVNSRGEVILPFENEKLRYSYLNHPYYITLNNNHAFLKVGNIDTKEIYFEIGGQPFLNGLRIDIYHTNERRKYYVSNITNAHGFRSIYNFELKKFVNSPAFHFEEILDEYETYLVEDKNGKKGLADVNGKLLTGFEFDMLYQSSIESDLIFAYKNGKVGFIDGKGKVIIPIIHEPVKDALGGIVASQANYGFSNDLKSNGKIIHYDRKGNKIFPRKYNLPEDVNFANIYAGRQNTVIAFTDKLLVIDPFNKSLSYDYNLHYEEGNLSDKQAKKGHTYLWFNGGIEPFVKNGKYGYFDVWGNVVIPPVFDKASAFNPFGYCYVMKDNEYFLIDNHGQRLPFIDVALYQYKIKNRVQ